MITRGKTLPALLIPFALLAGCTTTQYRWGSYSEDLYSFYKNPTSEEQLALQEELVHIFQQAEAQGAVPPPGLYAEYATFLFKQGDYQSATLYYEKEKEAWPDSTQYMDALINAMARVSSNQLPEVN